MFNMEYVAANCGADIKNGGDVFYTESLTSNASGVITLAHTPVAVVSGGEAKVWYRLASEGGADMTAKVASGNTLTDLIPSTDYCVMYRYTDDAAKEIVINAQFIPETLHAVLTVALYLGDACDVTAATKAGEVEIDIPRFQLSGAMDITMSATGSAQTPLEGNALASGCTGCEGNGIYATITRVIFNSHWYDDARGIILENAARTATVGDTVSETFNAYVYYATGAPKAVPATNFTWTFAAGTTGLTNTNNVVSGTAAAGTATITAVAKDDDGAAIPALSAIGTITVTE